MSLLQPLALGFLALLPVIVVFHILRARHQLHQVPSTRFWRGVPSDLEGRPTWRLPRPSLLLFLQLLIVAILAAALARPASISGTKRHLVLVLDAAVSMQATDVQPSRFEGAKREARDLVAGLSSGDDVTLVQADRGPAILAEATADEPAALLGALAGAAPSAGPSDMFSALALATSLAGQHPDARNEIVVLSDGVFPQVNLDRLGSAPVDLRMQTIGRSPNNLAVTEFSLRSMLGSLGRQVAFVRVTNYGDQPTEVPMRALADGLPVDTRRLKLPANGSVELTVNLPAGSKLAEVRLDTDDYLRLDDQALATVPAPRKISVTLVSANTGYWDRVLQAVPGLTVTKASPADYKPGSADVFIFDGFQPTATEWPDGNVFLVNPLPKAPAEASQVPVSIVGESTGAQIVRAEQSAPLLAGVDLASLSLPKSLKIKLPAWARSVADTAGGPLLMEGTYAGHHAVVVGFDPAQTDLPQRLAFPLIVANALSELAPADSMAEVRPGDIVDIQPSSGATEIQVRFPSGKIEAQQLGVDSIRFAQTEAIGRYTVIQRARDNVLSQQDFVVNAIDEAASDIRPNDRALGDGLSRATAEGAGGPRQLEVWPFVLATGLALLSGEWWYYCRRNA